MSAVSHRQKLLITFILLVVTSFFLFGYRRPPVSVDQFTSKDGIGLNIIDPRLVSFIRQHVIISPPAPGTPINLDRPHVRDPSQYGQAKFVLQLLRQFKGDNEIGKDGGFFIEAGAFDGERHSNTLLLEMSHGWHGLLIEPDPKIFSLLQRRQRPRAFLANVGLATSARSHTGHFLTRSGGEELGGDPQAASAKRQKFLLEHGGYEYDALCVPLYSLLLALNKTRVDYLSLDVELVELEVLKTIPFNMVDIKVVGVEYTVSEDDRHRNSLSESKKYSALQAFFNSLRYMKTPVKYRQVPSKSGDMFFVKE